MDPNAALANILRYADRIADGVSDEQNRVDYDAAELAQAVYALHDWIRRGGFPPDAWRGTKQTGG